MPKRLSSSMIAAAFAVVVAACGTANSSTVAGSTGDVVASSPTASPETTSVTEPSSSLVPVNISCATGSTTPETAGLAGESDGKALSMVTGKDADARLRLSLASAEKTLAQPLDRYWAQSWKGGSLVIASRSGSMMTVDGVLVPEAPTGAARNIPLAGPFAVSDLGAVVVVGGPTMALMEISADLGVSWSELTLATPTNDSWWEFGRPAAIQGGGFVVPAALATPSSDRAHISRQAFLASIDGQGNLTQKPAPLAMEPIQDQSLSLAASGSGRVVATWAQAGQLRLFASDGGIVASAPIDKVTVVDLIFGDGGIHFLTAQTEALHEQLTDCLIH